MNNRSPFSALRIISLFFLLLAIVLTLLQLIRFSRIRAYYPIGMTVASVPVGGLDRQMAAQRLLEAYAQPIALHYNDSVIHLDPQSIDFKIDVDNMLSAADLERNQTSFWEDFWDYLWGRTTFPVEVPLRAAYSEELLRSFLKDVAERYDQAPVAAMPLPGTVDFQPAQPGTLLDNDLSVLLVENALANLTSRDVFLPLKESNPPRPAFQNLEILLRQTLQVAGFDGLAGIYLLDLQTSQETHFAVWGGNEIPVNPDIAFTASSIIKIPIMVSTFRRLPDDPDAETIKLLEDMIDKSGNEVGDWLMDRVFESNKAPLIVSEDMKKLGLENTFLAGYFSLGSPLLTAIETPANARTDITTDPDPYSQTTPSDIGMLLEDLYQCSESGGGAITAVFPSEITQDKCEKMVNYLIANKLPMLITAGIPEGTPIAHKHGWVSTNGIINTVGDAGIVYSPGGNYIFVVFLYHPEQLIWDPASTLIADLSRAVYNYYNLPEQQKAQ